MRKSLQSHTGQLMEPMAFTDCTITYFTGEDVHECLSLLSACSERDNSRSVFKFIFLLSRITIACEKRHIKQFHIYFPAVVQNIYAVFCSSAGKGLPQEISEYIQIEAKMGVEIRFVCQGTFQLSFL